MGEVGADDFRFDNRDTLTGRRQFAVHDLPAEICRNEMPHRDRDQHRVEQRAIHGGNGHLRQEAVLEETSVFLQNSLQLHGLALQNSQLKQGRGLLLHRR